MTTLMLATAWRTIFLVLSAPVIGAALMAAVGAVTGARWPAGERAATLLPAAVLGAAVLGAAQAATPAPPHLTLWLHPMLVGLRGALVIAALWLATMRLRRDRSATVAGVTLAVYAWLVTPIASDWLLGIVPGHPASAAGMMLVCEQVAAACALPLALDRAGERERRDLAKLMVAAMLGLGYLIFVDYLIIWFGNLPSRVDFYAARGAGSAPVPLVAALVFGWVGPIALLATGSALGRRWAGAGVLGALVLTNLWWLGADVAAALIAVLGIAAGAGAAWLAGRPRRQPAHG